MALQVTRRRFLSNTLGSAGCVVGLSACGGGTSAQSAPAAAAPLTTSDPAAEAATNRYPPTSAPLFPLQPTDIASIQARPESFLSLYDALASSGSTAAQVVRQKLGTPFSTLDDSAAIATFATAAAFSMAPGGSAAVDPITTTLQQLVTAPALSCGHYCKLATLFSLLRYPSLMPPDLDAPSAKPTLHFIIWLDTVPLQTGLHSQLVLANVLQNAYLLLDPFYAFALRIPYGTGTLAPQPQNTVVENAATILQTPLDPSNLVVLDSRGTAPNSALLQTMIGGQLSPAYIYHDSIYGSEGWDQHIAQTIRNMS